MNLASIVDAHPAEAPALISDGATVPYGALRERVARARGGLLVRGLQPGQRVALMLPTSVDFVVAYLAVLGAGGVAVPLNPQSPPAELARELATVRPVLLAGAGAGAAGPVEAGGDEGAAAAGAAVFGVETTTVAGLETAEPADRVERDPTDPAVLLFTSGTAGFPKAAVLTHGSLLANLDQMAARFGPSVGAGDVGLLVLPSSHVFGLNAVLGMHLFVGAALVLEERFDAAATLDLVRRWKVTIFGGVPTVFAALAAHPGAGPDDLSSLRLSLSGAAPLPAEVARRFAEKFGKGLLQGYGLTEASPAVAFPDPADPAAGAGSVGRALPGVEVRVVDVDGEEVVAGDPGEVLVRGPNVFAGYFEDPGATAGVLDRAGWLHTGDVAVMAGDGTLTLVDRRKDLVIVSGFNVYPAEVERVLSEHPAVEAVAVVGVPDPATGEAVQAFVVPAGGSGRGSTGGSGGAGAGGGAGGDAEAGADARAEELIRHCARHLARYKCPTRVSFVHELPRGPGGELLRRALR